MTSIQSVLAAIAIILIDLLGRAGLDKVLAITAGPTMVGLWAQLQSVLDVVSGVATTGIAQGRNYEPSFHVDDTRTAFRYAVME